MTESANRTEIRA